MTKFISICTDWQSQLLQIVQISPFGLPILGCIEFVLVCKVDRACSWPCTFIYSCI